MALTIKIKRFKNGYGEALVTMPEFIKKGDWVDLRCADDITLKAPQSGTLKTKSNGEKYRNVSFNFAKIPLGIAMELPKGYESLLVLRSSIPDGKNILQANVPGIIDNSYCGNNDQWFLKVLAVGNTTILRNERICQFRIQLKQTATIWQKIKWFFTNTIELKEVDELENDDRGGNGSTGKE